MKKLWFFVFVKHCSFVLGLINDEVVVRSSPIMMKMHQNERKLSYSSSFSFSSWHMNRLLLESCKFIWEKAQVLVASWNQCEQLFKWLPKSPFSIATPQLHEALDQTGNRIQTTPRIPSFWQGVICHIWPSQFGGHREQTRGVRLGI